MNETIRLMKSHFSVLRFKEEAIKEADLKEILLAGQMASSWKNFQSYSVIVVKSKEKKEALYDLLPQEAIRQSDVFLLFVGDLNRAEKAVKLHEQLTLLPIREQSDPCESLQMMAKLDNTHLFRLFLRPFLD